MFHESLGGFYYYGSNNTERRREPEGVHHASASVAHSSGNPSTSRHRQSPAGRPCNKPATQAPRKGAQKRAAPNPAYGPRVKYEQSLIVSSMVHGKQKTVIAQDLETAQNPTHWLKQVPDASVNSNYEKTTLDRNGVTRRIKVKIEDKAGKHRKVGKGSYYVRKQEVVKDRWSTWQHKSLPTETSQQSYFVQESEDEDEKEYLKAATDDFDMNW